MKKLKYQIRTIDPIIISAESGNQFLVPTKDFIPGVNIIGALALKYIRQNNLEKYFSQIKPDDPDFINWFINAKISYSNAYKTDRIGEIEYATYPLPFSIQHIKNNEKDVYDLFYNNPSEQTKTFNGFGMLKDDKLFITRVHKSTNPHHERDYKSGAARPEFFYNYESIDANQTFEGIISGDEESINKFYNYFSNVNQLKIGRAKTTEYGKVQFDLFNEPDAIANNIICDNGNDISLTFLSNVILYNDNGFATSSYSNLEGYLKTMISNNLIIKNAFLRTEENENYVSVWKAKKPTEVSFKAGSCLLLTIDNNDKVVAILNNLQNTGIGERTHEGFGRIIFGLQKEKQFTNSEVDKIKHLKPVGSEMPGLVKNSVIKNADSFLQNITAVEAINIVKDNSIRLKQEKQISSSQISKLEGFVKISNSDFEHFKNKINQLRIISQKKLKGCHFDDGNLFVFLTEESYLNNDNIANGLKSVISLFNDIGIDQSETNKLSKKLFDVFYLTLFSEIRKAIKGGK